MVKVRMAAPVLQQNDEVARENRELFHGKRVFVLNLMSSPGSGKTSILEKTIGKLSERLKLGVIEGDIYTSRDAERIEKIAYYVDRKMRLVGQKNPQLPLSKVAVLAALNISEDLVKLHEDYELLSKQLDEVKKLSADNE
jgi:Ni2+-binding GTPase involved in maturation of urease and hydrogenase